MTSGDMPGAENPTGEKLMAKWNFPGFAQSHAQHHGQGIAERLTQC
jgi:hypothetical protein